MDKIIEELKNLKSMIQMVEHKVEEIQKSNQPHESNLEKLEKEVMNLNLKDLIADNKLNHCVLISNTKQFPVIDDYLEEYYNIYKIKPSHKLLRDSTFGFVKGLTNKRTIEILLKMGANPNCRLVYRYDMLSDLFDYENDNFKGNQNYKTVGDLLFANGYKINHDILLIQIHSRSQCPFDENQIGYIDYCIEKIPKDDVKKIIIEIVDSNLYYEKCKEILLEKFFKAYHELIMEMLNK